MPAGRVAGHGAADLPLLATSVRGLSLLAPVSASLAQGGRGAGGEVAGSAASSSGANSVGGKAVDTERLGGGGAVRVLSGGDGVGGGGAGGRVLSGGDGGVGRPSNAVGTSDAAGAAPRLLPGCTLEAVNQSWLQLPKEGKAAAEKFRVAVPGWVTQLGGARDNTFPYGELACFKDGEWLNDEAINAQLLLLQVSNCC